MGDDYLPIKACYVTRESSSEKVVQYLKVFDSP